MFRTQNDMTAQFSPKKSQCKYTDSPCKKSQVKNNFLHIFPKSTLINFWSKIYLSPVFSTNAENAVNFQVNFINLHHPLQGLKLPSLHLWKIENLIFVHYLHHSLHHFILTSLFTSHFTAKLDFCPSFTSSFTSLFTYINIYITFYSKT